MKTIVCMTLIAMTVALVFVTIAMAEDQEKSGSSGTYMGVDANDKEAVERRQKELNHEKWHELFGKDASVEDMDFSGFDTSSVFSDSVTKLKDALKKVIKRFGEKKQSTEEEVVDTPTPSY